MEKRAVLDRFGTDMVNAAPKNNVPPGILIVIFKYTNMSSCAGRLAAPAPASRHQRSGDRIVAAKKSNNLNWEELEMLRLLLGPVFGLVLAVPLLAGQLMHSAPALAGEQMHKVAVHVDESDPKRINMALNNVQNLKAYYESKGQAVEIEVVAYGPGLHMLRADSSPVLDRISAMSLEIENLTFSGCGNTLKGMSRKEGKEIELLSEARIVPSGVVRLVELQEGGYAYVRP